MNAPLCQAGAKSHTFPHELKNHYALLTEVGDLTYLFRNISKYTNFKLSLLKETWKIVFHPRFTKLYCFCIVFIILQQSDNADSNVILFKKSKNFGRLRRPVKIIWLKKYFRFPVRAGAGVCRSQIILTAPLSS